MAEDEGHDHGHGRFPVELWEAADLITPMAIRVAATLRLADHLAAGTTTASGLAGATGADPDALGRLLEHLVTAGMLRRAAEDGYGLTGLGEQLTEAHPGGGRAWLDIDGAVGRDDLALLALEHSVRTGEPAYPEVHGRSFWADLADDPALSASFDALMGAQSAWRVPAVVAAYDWTAVDHVVDVGGGDGTLLAGILEAQPGLRGTLVELAGPAGAAERRFAEAGLADRAEAVTGSFFDPLPAAGDVCVLSGIVHDWDDPEAVAILTRCREAAGPEGAVLLVEGVRADDAADREISTHMDLRMLAYTGGRERTREELAVLADRAGLTLAAVTPLDERRSLVELAPHSASQPSQERPAGSAG